MLAFGNLGVAGGKLTVQGWLYDVKNIQSPQVLGKQYNDTATDAAARMMAHKFADEIIYRLGGGIQGIAETQIYFVSDRTGHKEIWAMDYDGSNQHQITRLGSIALSPRVSPDGTRLAFSALTKSGWEIMMYSLELNRMISFPHMAGTNLSPAWSGDGTKLAFSSSRSGEPEIYVSDASGANPHRMTADQRAGCVSGLESQDQCPNRICQRPHGPAADLDHGSRRHQPAAHDRSGLRRFTQLAAQWPVPGFRLGPQVRPGRARLI